MFPVLPNIHTAAAGTPLVEEAFAVGVDRTQEPCRDSRQEDHKSQHLHP